MAEQLYAIVFKRDFEPGEHWNANARHDDPDRQQHWRAGDLYSVGTSVADPLPAHLEAIAIDPPPEGARWDRETRTFIAPSPEQKEAELTETIKRLVQSADVPDEAKMRVLASVHQEQETVTLQRAAVAAKLDANPVS